jgi:hypothetical protein
LSAGTDDVPSVVVNGDQSLVLTHRGQKVRVHAVVKGPDGQVVPGAKLHFESTRKSNVSINSSGVLTARVGLGSASILIQPAHTIKGTLPAAVDVVVAPPSARTHVIPSSDVISANSSRATLVANTLTLSIRKGDRVVSGSAGGLLGLVDRATRSGSTVRLVLKQPDIVKSFKKLKVNVQGASQSADLTVSNGTATIRRPDGSLVSRLPANQLVDCQDGQSGDVPVSLDTPSVTAPITFNGFAALQSEGPSGPVTSFNLGVRISVPVKIAAGIVKISGAGHMSATCSLKLPTTGLASPVGIGPMEFYPTVSPSVGVTIGGTSAGATSFDGPTLSAQLSETTGIQWSTSSGWKPLYGSRSSAAISPPVIREPVGLDVTVDPYFNVNEGLSASVLSSFSLSPVNLAYVNLNGPVSTSSHPPFDSSTLGYSGPKWQLNGTISDGVELDLSGPMRQLLGFFGLAGTSQAWSSYSYGFAGASPSFAVSASPTSTTAGAVTLTTEDGSGFDGDRVEFYGFQDSSQTGRLLGSTTVEAGSAVVPWTPTQPADVGNWAVVARLYPSTGPVLPYASSEAPAYVTVVGGGQHPQVRSFSASPQALPSTGGPVTLHADLTGAATCRIDVSPHLSGFPQSSIDCSNGSFSQQVVLPANALSSATTYTFTLTVTGPSGDVVTARAGVVVHPPIGPSILQLTAGPQTLSSAGGQATVGATVQNATSCHFESSPAVAGFPTPVENCAAGTIIHKAQLPANTGSTPITYTFTLVAVGSDGKAEVTASVSVVVEAALKPYITSFDATPTQLASSGGQVEFAWGGVNITNWCINEPTNFPNASSACFGTSTNGTLMIPPNTSRRSVSYTFTLSGNGSTNTTPATQAITISELGAGTSNVSSEIAGAKAVTLPAGGSDYLYVGATAGGRPLLSVSWGEDLSLNALYNGNKSVSIGQSTANTGSFTTGAKDYALAGAVITGWTVVRKSEFRASMRGTVGGKGYRVPGETLRFRFATAPKDRVLILVGGQGTGFLKLSGIRATTLQSDTYSETNSENFGSAAIYYASLTKGSHVATITSTTSVKSLGTSLGAVVYYLRRGAG